MLSSIDYETPSSSLLTTTITVIMSTKASFLLLFFIAASSASHHNSRHLLHHPFFPLLPPTQPPSLPPHPDPLLHPQTQPKYPFSTTPTTPQQPFFPSLPSPPPPPPPTSSFLSTFPANISSLLLPHHPPSTSFHRNLILTISISLSLLFAAVLAVVASLFFWSRRNHQHYTPPKSDNLRLFPPDTVLSDGSPNPPKLPRRPGVPNTSSEFLYLGTLVNPHSGVIDHEAIASLSNASVKSETSVTTRPYQKLGSPELNPLPPLPRYNICTPTFRSGEVLVMKKEADADTDEGEEFFSPRGSSGRKDTLEDNNPSVVHDEFSSRRHNYGSTSFNSRSASYPYSNSCSSVSVSTSPSLVLKMSPLSSKSMSPDTIISFRAPVQVQRTYLPSGSISASSSSSPSGTGSGNIPNSPDQTKQTPGRTESVTAQQFAPTRLPPPPPPPPPPPRFWELPVGARMVEDEVNFGNSGPPVLVTPSKPAFVNEHRQCYRIVEMNEESPRPKLKPLHWDKVRASSDRAMVWDHIKSSSFQLNEEMIETLFVVNNSHFNDKDNKGRRLSLPLPNQENRVLDPKKSQNIAIFLRALNVTIDEVCEALLEGNSDTLGTELLESLLKMSLTEEEERKLREFKDESPFKLGPAEKFLKAVLDVPFAFKRVDAMLYITNFDSEVEYLRNFFETLEAASEELKNSRMFLKLLEAVLKTGNRMNVGTNRGDAHAFKLDTLLKLVDVKGTDGKTTLLHFVVQEMIRSEGSRVSGPDENLSIESTQQLAYQDDVQFRKLGLQVVSGLCGELTNVKKAASMDSDVLICDVSKLVTGIMKIKEVLKLNEEIALKESSWRFSESMKGFLKKAEAEIVSIQDQERVVLSLVKEITEYFHGSSVKEEAHQVRIFRVVKDFLSILDQVCREIGKINERTIYSSVRPRLETSILPPVFPGLNSSLSS